MPTLKYLDPITGTYKPVLGSPGPSVPQPPPSGVWGTAPLDSSLYGSNSLIGREIYVDGNGQLRAKPDVVELGGGVDLNTITRTGNWTQSQTAEAGTGTNYPVALAGLLEVVTNSSSMVWQRYTVYSSNGSQYGNIYSRGSYQGTWYPWREVLPADTGWVAISIVAGFAAHTDPPVVRRIGKIVQVKGAFTTTGMGVNGSYSAGIIPAGFEPPLAFYQAAGCSSGSITAQFVIGASAGNTIQVRTGAALSTAYYLSGSWTID